MIEPISFLLRPQNLDWFIWQKHLVGDEWIVQRFLKSNKVPSMIFRWPPWTGKTTLANIISNNIKADFFKLSWVTSKKDDLKKIIEKAKTNTHYKIPTILFLDEIHRWNKAQQDTLLPFVEEWLIILIGATTENPSFSINNALISRTKVLIFEKIQTEEVEEFLLKNLKEIKKTYPDTKLNKKNINIISKLTNGDLRQTLNLLETLLIYKQKDKILEEDILKIFEKSIYYDREGEEHYNIISAVHKSLRDGDADAACYWIQRMLVWWEDPIYIARRLLRFASEDIWLANNNALLLANQVFDAVKKVWLPECSIFLMQLWIYLAQSPKSNLSYKVDMLTRKDVEKFGNLEVPKVLRNAPTQFMKDIWYGEWYKYSHNYENNEVDQQHFPDKLLWRKYLS